MPAKWTALVPLKPGRLRKSRLAAVLSAEEREALSEQMAEHVTTLLETHPLVGDIVLLAAEKPAGWRHGWIEDHGRGLNVELEAARDELGAERLLILHADLPALGADDLDVLLSQDSAIAPDRHGTGTNALTIPAGSEVRLRFGPNSFARHRAQYPEAAVVTRPGLANDVDVPEDLSAITYSPGGAPAAGPR